MRKHTSKPPERQPSLPAPPTTFVGRARELERLGRLYRKSAPRVLTLVGPPGIGKTRLALELARRGLGAPVRWLSLETARSLDDACTLLAEALGVPASRAEGAVERLGQALAKKGRIVLLCDNFEPVVESAAAAVASWCDMAPKALFLITSREALRIDAEKVVDVAPLDVPDPAGLHAERARLADSVCLLLERAPGFELDDESAPIVAELLRELEGIPLAIELAAARLPVMGPREMLARMHERLDLLSDRRRSTDQRHATLRATLDWSWELLRAEERRALAVSGAFHGGFRLDAFEAVAPTKRHAFDLLQALSEKSLLRATRAPGGEVRFGLYKALRDYAAERLASDPDAELVRVRHARYYAEQGLQQALNVGTANGEDALRWLGAELENVLGAWRFLLSSSSLADHRDLALKLLLAAEPLLSRRGPHRLHLALLQQAADVPALAGADPGLRARVQAARARALQQRGELVSAAQVLADAQVFAEQAGDVVLLAELAEQAGQLELWRGQFEAARARFEAGLQILGERDEPAARARLMAGLGLLHHSQGRLDEALVSYQQALPLAQRSGDLSLAFGLNKDLGALRLAQARFDEAREHFGKALSVPALLQPPNLVGAVEGNLGILEQECGDLAKAREHYRRAQDIFLSTGEQLLAAHILGYLGTLNHEQGDLASAAAQYGDAVTVLRSVGDRRLEGTFLAALGALQADRGRPAAARESFDHAARLLESVGDEALPLALELHRAHLLLPAAGNTASDGRSKVEAVIDAARRRAPLLSGSDDARFALRLLERKLRAHAIVVQVARQCVQLPDAELIELSRRAPLWRIVLALAERAQQPRAAAMSVEDLLDAGWPGERIKADAAQNRVKVALSTLRSLGFRKVLQRARDGYRLDPAIPVLLAE